MQEPHSLNKQPHKKILSNIALSLSLLGLGGSLLVSGAVLVGALEVPWDAKILPVLILAGLVPFCAVGFVTSIVACYINRDIRSVVAVCIGVSAIVASLGTLFLVIATAVAGHPL